VTQAHLRQWARSTPIHQGVSLTRPRPFSLSSTSLMVALDASFSSTKDQPNTSASVLNFVSLTCSAPPPPPPRSVAHPGVGTSPHPVHLVHQPNSGLLMGAEQQQQQQQQQQLQQAAVAALTKRLN
jgi:hypothetical protein